MKTLRHIPQQTVSPIIDPPIKFATTIQITGDHARLWRAYRNQPHIAEFDPSDASVAQVLIKRGLDAWRKEAGL